MTVEAGWIGKAKAVSAIVPVFEAAEIRDSRDGTNLVRNQDGQSYLALAYQASGKISHTYDFIDKNTSLDDWEKLNQELNNISNLVMATMTRAANLTTHAKIPAVTVRELPEHTLITGTVGSATKCANLLGIEPSKGDTEDIADWVVERGIKQLPNTLEQITEQPCNMHMVFSLLERNTNKVTVNLVRSRHDPDYSNKPYLHYLYSDNSITYSSLAEEAIKLKTERFIAIAERDILTFEISLE